MVAEGIQDRTGRDKCLDEYWDMAEDPAVSVEKEQEGSPLLEAAPRPKQAALAVKGQQVVVVEQRWTAGFS